MPKDSASSVRSMQDIGKLVTFPPVNTGAAESDLPPDLPEPDLAAKQQEAHGALAWEERNTASIRKYGRQIGEILADEKIRHLRMNDVRNAMDLIVKTVENAASLGFGIKGRMVLALMDSVIESFPADNLSMRCLCDLGLRVGFLERDADLHESQCVPLPFTVSKGKVRTELFTTRCPGSKGMLAEIRAKAEAADARWRTQRGEELERLYKDVSGTLLEVLKAGNGEAAFLVPEKRGKGFDLPGGHVRIVVRNGYIKAVDAVGALARTFKEIAEADTYILVDTLKNEYLSPKAPKFAQILHSIVRRGRLHAETEAA